MFLVSVSRCVIFCGQSQGSGALLAGERDGASGAMPAGGAQLARRAFVRLLISTAVAYAVAVNLTQRSTDQEVGQAFRKVVKKVHPDKGGSVADMQRLQEAKQSWESAKDNARRGRRPGQAERGQGGQPQNHPEPGAGELADPREARLGPEYRLGNPVECGAFFWRAPRMRGAHKCGPH